MKAALLGNGSSRTLYNDSTGYDYTIGCNIPWTKVDSTVVIDKEVLDNIELPTRFYCSRNAWRDVDKRERFSGCLIELFDSLPEYDSTGHAAARILVKLGAKQIDIYGCDSWFKNDTESFTHKYVDSRSDDMSKNVSAWRANWYKLKAEHPEVKFNFIGDPT